MIVTTSLIYKVNENFEMYLEGYHVNSIENAPIKASIIGTLNIGLPTPNAGLTQCL